MSTDIKSDPKQPLPNSLYAEVVRVTGYYREAAAHPPDASNPALQPTRRCLA